MIVSQSKPTFACGRASSARTVAVCVHRLPRPSTSPRTVLVSSTVTDAVEPSANATGTGSAASISIEEAPADGRVPWYKKPCVSFDGSGQRGKVVETASKMVQNVTPQSCAEGIVSLDSSLIC